MKLILYLCFMVAENRLFLGVFGEAFFLPFLPFLTPLHTLVLSRTPLASILPYLAKRLDLANHFSVSSDS